MKKILLASMLCVLSACTLPPMPTSVVAVKPTAYHNVAYYDAHPMERDQANAWCGNNPGLADKVPSCANADESGIHAFDHRMGWN